MSAPLSMTEDLITVLDALYRVERQKLQRSEFNAWTTPHEVAAALPPQHPYRGNGAWTRERLEELWTARKVQQLPAEVAKIAEMRDVRLRGLDVHGDEDGRLRNEQNDARGPDSNGSEFAQVAIYSGETPVKYRSRVAELGRLLNNNYQRFHMAPAPAYCGMSGESSYGRFANSRSRRFRQNGARRSSVASCVYPRKRAR